MSRSSRSTGGHWLAATALFVVVGCGAGEPPGLTKPPATELRVVFRLPGDDFGGPEELRERDRVARVIEVSGAGRVVSSGNGTGFMELRVEPADSIRAEERIRAAVTSARTALHCEVTRD